MSTILAKTPGRFVEFDGEVMLIVDSSYEYNCGLGDMATHLTLEDDEGNFHTVTLDELADSPVWPAKPLTRGQASA